MIGQFERARSMQIAEWREKVLSMLGEFIDRIAAEHGEPLVARAREALRTGDPFKVEHELRKSGFAP
jgi:hypothetical protein